MRRLTFMDKFADYWAQQIENIIEKIIKPCLFLNIENINDIFIKGNGSIIEFDFVNLFIKYTNKKPYCFCVSGMSKNFIGFEYLNKSGQFFSDNDIVLYI